ncbi:MAG: DUF4249 family protein [Bacteroidota bacterium]
MKLFLTLSAFTILIIGCNEPSSPSDYQKEVVVDGILVAENPIDSIDLHWTGEIDKFYDPASYAITNATVIITGVGFSFEDSLVHHSGIPGRYVTSDTTKKIVPTRTYALTITLPDGKMITGMTTVPDTFSIIASTLKNNDTVKYDTKAPLNTFEWSDSKFQGTYLPTLASLDDNAALIPKFFDRDTINNPKPSKIGYRIGLPKNQTNTILPWLFFNYYGSILCDIYAADDNFTDYLIQQNGGGELNQTRYRLNGAIGVFGSVARAHGTIKIYLTP